VDKDVVDEGYADDGALEGNDLHGGSVLLSWRMIRRMTHCHLIQAGDLQAVVGDASRDGVGGRQYCGLWSLTSKHRVFNAFGNSYAGLLPGELRGKAPILEAVDDTTAVLRRDADARRPTSARASYRVVAPHTIEHELTLCDEVDVRGPDRDFREVSWCCYMNGPADPRLHFRSEGQWRRYISPKHGVHSNVAPSYIDATDLEVWPPADPRPFHWHRTPFGFDEPFYYGRLGPMVLLLVFSKPKWLRFFCSPSGGGGSLLRGRTCPAWDFEWVVPGSAYAPGRDYTFGVRLIYKPFVSDDDVLDEVILALAQLDV
jgi:hypothetical protein